MRTAESYEQKLEALKDRAHFVRLPRQLQDFVLERARKYRFTFQELRIVCEAALDVEMWGEASLPAWWSQQEAELVRGRNASKEDLLAKLQSWLHSLRSEAKSYPETRLEKPAPLPLHSEAAPSDKNIVGACPVASEETVCCNLRTIDAVENCGFGCSYCTIQTFYGDKVVFDASLGEKLKKLNLDPNRIHHLGTGQSSDSLMWGNQHGILDALCEFADRNPSVLLELKTKSKNVAYFLGRRVPRNIVVSWSLNTPTIIDHEEHFTARLSERLAAARQVADCGVKVAFHFHPIVFYQTWRQDYRDLVHQVTARFASDEVVFTSLGSVTFIKPIVKAIRERGRPTKMLQMELVPGPKGKLSYPDSLKKEMFSHVYEALAPWHGQVFMYLCMEQAALWESTFGFAYSTNEEFEEDFGKRVFMKIDRTSGEA